MKIDGLTFFIIECSIMLPLTVLFIIGSVKETKKLMKELQEKQNKQNQNNQAAADHPDT